MIVSPIQSDEFTNRSGRTTSVTFAFQTTALAQNCALVMITVLFPLFFRLNFKTC